MALPFFEIGMKTDLFHPVATDEFSKFADILSTALSQRYLSGFEIAGITGIPSPPLALFIVMLSKAHWTSHSRMSDSR